ncbi:MAG: hypothetical protein K2H76_06130 [Muribaculaceae bacterium]|nr:hypothetical protein [Muribaculaceae bacterium]MDE6027629.1 hypothetical protein [Muribaculaceae bacterium]
MSKEERMAIARIFSDLIKADRIVDTGEMECWEKVCDKYKITKDIRVDARELSFADALNIICKDETSNLRAELLADCREMTVSDGFCAHSEALLIIALTVMLDNDCNFFGEVYSIPRASFNIDISTALYIENFYDLHTNNAIRVNYRSIFKELQLAGFHFVYIPKIIEHYRDTDPLLFKRILSFLSPSTSDEGLDYIYNSLMDMTTAFFCQDILCNKCDIPQLRNTVPSLFIKIGNSFVGEEPYANYLRIEVDGDILKTVQEFADRFCDLLSSDVYVVNTSEERDNQFHFHGFYKQLLDIFLVRRNIRSRVLIDPYRSKITFPDIDADDKGLTRRDRVFYTLLLCYGQQGMDFKRPTNVRNLHEYEERISRMQNQFTLLYEIFGGNPEEAPDISEQRLQIIAHIRKLIKKLDALYNKDDYSISSTNRSIYAVHLEQDKVWVVEPDSETPVALVHSKLYRRVKSESLK